MFVRFGFNFCKKSWAGSKFKYKSYSVSQTQTRKFKSSTTLRGNVSTA
jgi:hypothetical protein